MTHPSDRDDEAVAPATAGAAMDAPTGSPVPCVGPGSYLTLHYRISLARSGENVVSTFGGRPATLQLGLGQLAEPLERCLFGLPEGRREVVTLSPEHAYGPRNPALLRRVSRRDFEARSEAGATFVPGDLVEFPAPGGGRFAGVLKELSDDDALFDFNHPLAGHDIVFEVEILSVL